MNGGSCDEDLSALKLFLNDMYNTSSLSHPLSVRYLALVFPACIAVLCLIPRCVLCAGCRVTAYQTADLKSVGQSVPSRPCPTSQVRRQHSFEIML